MDKVVLIMHHDAEWLCENLRADCPGYSFQAASNAQDAAEYAPRTQILCALAPFIPADLIRAMPRLEWIHAFTTGVDNLLSMEALRPDVVITNSRGMHGPQMSELAILLMMALARDFPRMIRNQENALWKSWPQPLLLGKTVCIVGLGVIAEVLASRCAAFGMRITGVSDGRSELDRLERVYKRSELRAAAADADFLVVLVPYSPQTHHLVDAGVLEAMKPGAYLINISRGGCVDEAALLAHLREGRIAGAALDVFATEPLPPESPFWSTPNVIVTPHVGGMSDIFARQALPIVRSNLAAYAAGGAGAVHNRIERQG